MKFIVLVLALLYSTPIQAQDFQSIQVNTYEKAPRITKGLHRSRSKVSHKGRPAKWCGWWARQQKGVRNPSYNRAIYWLNYGHPTEPRIGAVVIWPHHVGIITGRDSRGWLVTSGNWSNRVATVPLSQMGRDVRGYRI